MATTQLRGRNENSLFRHLSMKYQFSRFSVKSEKSFLQFSVKTKDNENSTKHGAVKTVKSDLSMKYQKSDISLIIYLFSLYLYPFF